MEKRVTRILPVKLTTREVVERGQLAAQVIRQIDDVDRVKKQAAADAKESSDRLESELRRLSYIVEREEEDRTVECFWRFDFMKNEKNLIREDTGEVVETKAMTDEERQIALEIGDEKQQEPVNTGVQGRA